MIRTTFLIQSTTIGHSTFDSGLALAKGEVVSKRGEGDGDSRLNVFEWGWLRMDSLIGRLNSHQLESIQLGRRAED